VLNPPPEFFELRPVTKNLFQKFAKVEPSVETATASSTTAFLPEVTSSQAEYAEEDYNNYTEPPETGGAFEEAQASEQSEHQSDQFYQEPILKNFFSFRQELPSNRIKSRERAKLSATVALKLSKTAIWLYET